MTDSIADFIEKIENVFDCYLIDSDESRLEILDLIKKNTSNNLIKFDNSDIIKFKDKYFNGTKNRCLTCNVDMGECNPRQLCGKWRCDND